MKTGNIFQERLIALVLGHLVTCGAASAQSTWNSNASANWSDPTRWTGGIPNAVGASATLGSIITSSRTITVNASVTVGSLTINDNNNYTLSRTAGTGTNLLTFDAAGAGPATITVANSGAPTISTSGDRLRVNLADNTVVNHTGTGVFTISTIVQGAGSLTRNGTGTMLLSGANTFSGGLIVNSGTTRFGNNTAAGTGTLTLNGGAIEASTAPRTLANAVTVGGGFSVVGTRALTLGGAMDLGGSQRTVTTTNTALTTFSGVVSGAGGLAKSGAGILTLSGANTYTGATAVNAGILRAGAAGTAFGTGSAITLANAAGASLDLAGFNTAIGSLAGGGASGGNVTLGAGTLTTGTNNASTSYGGIISGSGGIVKTGTGTQTLTGANTYSGTTTVGSGILTAQNAAALGTTAGGTVVSSGGSLGLAGGITITGETLQLAGSGAGGQGALFNSSGSNTFNGEISLNADTTIISDIAGETLTLGASAQNRTLANNGYTLTIDGVGDTYMQSQISGTGGLVKNGSGTTTLYYSAGALFSAYSGPTTVNAGALIADLGDTDLVPLTPLTGPITIGGAGQDASMSTRWFDNIGDSTVVNVYDRGTLRIDNSYYNQAGLSETVGGLNLRGGATVETINGATNPSTLILNGGVTHDGTGAATINGNLALGGAERNFAVQDGAAATELAVSAAISDGALTKSGTGTMALSGTAANTYSGATTVDGGTLVLLKSGGANAVAGSAVTLNSGGTLLLGGANQIADSTAMTLAGGAFSTGDGFSESLGALTLTGDSSISLGSLLHSLQFAASNVEVWSPGATLTIYGWTGMDGISGLTGKVFFGGNDTSLTLDQLSRISFNGFSGAQLLATGELVPMAVPESRVVIAAALLVLLVLWRERKALSAVLRPCAAPLTS